MSKYYGAIGFGTTIETEPGSWNQEIVERYYSGDVLRISRRNQTSDKVNDNITVSMKISVVTKQVDDFFKYDLKYVTYYGVKWKITDIEEQYPRVILTLGDRYND